MMKKRLVVILCLVLTACLLTGCGYMPALMGDMLGSSQNGAANATVDGDSVIISKEEYERYKQIGRAHV